MMQEPAGENNALDSREKQPAESVAESQIRNDAGPARARPPAGKVFLVALAVYSFLFLLVLMLFFRPRGLMGTRDT